MSLPFSWLRLGFPVKSHCIIQERYSIVPCLNSKDQSRWEQQARPNVVEFCTGYFCFLGVPFWSWQKRIRKDV